MLGHIGGDDQATYGGEPPALKQHEIAHLAASGLPMSPYAAGAEQVVSTLAPGVGRALEPRNLAPSARAPLPALGLVPDAGRLLDGRALRDRVAALTAASAGAG